MSKNLRTDEFINEIKAVFDKFPQFKGKIGLMNLKPIKEISANLTSEQKLLLTVQDGKVIIEPTDKKNVDLKGCCATCVEEEVYCCVSGPDCELQ